MQRIFYLLVLSFFFVSCSSQKELPSIQKDNVVIYYQKWIAGVQGGGSGINIHVNFKTPLDENIIFEKAQILNYETSQINKIDDNHYTCIVKTNFNDKILAENPENEYGNQLPNINSYQALKEGTINLFFKNNGKSISKTFENVKEKELLAYPSAKPRN
jgi:L-cysteine desulfidase